MTANEVVYVRDNGTKRVGIYFDRCDEHGVLLTPSLTKQAFKKDCDINNILAKYDKSQVLNYLNAVSQGVGKYGDFSDVDDYQTALHKLHDADEMFMQLPASIRKEFSNDPGQFLDFVANPDNFDKMVAMGLARPKAPEVPPVVEPTKEA